MTWKRAAVSAAGALLAGTALWFGGIGFWASRRLAHADREWAATFGSLEDFQKRYPKVETNATAKRVEELAKAAGYDLNERIPPPAELTQTPAEKRRSDARQAIFEWLPEQFQRADPSLEPVPREAQDFLQERSEHFAALEESLLVGVRAEWAMDVGRPDAGRGTYGWANYIGLQRALIARALVAASETHDAAAGRTLEASWILNEAVTRRPESLAQILGIAVARLQVGALRKIDVDGESWKPRLRAVDPRGLMVDEVALSTALVVGRMKGVPPQPASAEPQTYWSRLSDWLGAPWLLFSMADFEDAWRVELVRLRDAPLSDHSASSQPSTQTAFGRVMLSITIPNTRNAFLRADRLVVDAELTSKILEVKELRKKNGGRWPSSVRGIEDCTFPGASWLYDVSPEGRMTLSLSRDLASPFPNRRLDLPLRFSSN